MLPRLVIDLDASDSKFVKKAEEVEQNALKSPGGKKQAKNLVKSRKHSFRKITVKEGKPKIAFKTQTVTSPDLLHYALLGDPHASPSRENDTLRRIFKGRLIHPNDKAEIKVEQLTLDFTTDASQNLARAGFAQGQKDAVLEEIRVCESFTRLQRMISMISSSVNGCKFLADSGPDIVDRIRLCRKAQGLEFLRPSEISATAVLNLLNNLHLNMKSKGVHFPPSLCNAGLYYASKAFDLPAVRMYLCEISEMSHTSNWHTGQALRRLQQHIMGKTTNKRPWFPWMGENSRTAEVVKLITGWASPSGPTLEEERQLSFVNLLSHERSRYFKDTTGYREDLYRTYILGLGELGLADILWREWSTPDLTRISQRYVDDRFLKARVQTFAVAFLLAKDIDRALSIFNSVQWKRHSSNSQSLEPPSQPSASTSSQKDSRDELRKAVPLMQCLIMHHYSFHGLMPSDKLLSMVVKESLVEKQTPRDQPEKALKAIERLLLTGFHSTRAKNLTLDWATFDGQEGLLVMPKLGSRPAYFKTVTQGESQTVTDGVEPQDVHDGGPAYVNIRHTTERIDP